MVANPASARRIRRLWLIGPTCVAVPSCVVAVAGWWLTAPLEEPGSTIKPTSLLVASPAREAGSLPDAPASPPVLSEWPEQRLDGRAAKQYLLAFMEQAVRRLDEVESYTATMTRQERINGELGPEQLLKIKLQHEPFAVYLRFESPRAGREALYHEGRFDDHLLAHNGDWTRRIIPRMKLDPHGPVALADNRHPITDVGLAHLCRELLHFRHLDLDDPHAETILDRTTDEDGTPWYRSIHTHAVDTGDRPFVHVVVRYCPDLLIPLHITSYDWPGPGDEGEGEGEELPLAERYHYSDVELDASLSAVDFDPSNPEYEFQRY